eukprot:28754-Prymnesium_polylepis.1
MPMALTVLTPCRVGSRPRVRLKPPHAGVRIWASGPLPPLATVVRRRRTTVGVQTPELRSARSASKAHALTQRLSW